MRTWLRLTLVTLTVGGGFTGVALTSAALFTPQVRGANVAIFLIFLLLFGFVLVSGLVFVHDGRRTVPIIAALALQVPIVYSPVVVYKFACGLTADLGVTERGPFAAFRLGSLIRFELLRQSPWGVGINVVAAVLLSILCLGRWRAGRAERAAGSAPQTADGERGSHERWES